MDPQDEALVIEELARLSQGPEMTGRYAPGAGLEESVKSKFEEAEAWLGDNVTVSARYTRANLHQDAPGTFKRTEHAGRQLHYQPGMGVCVTDSGGGEMRPWRGWPVGVLVETAGLLAGLKNEAYKHQAKYDASLLQAAAKTVGEGTVNLPLLGIENAPGPDNEEEEEFIVDEDEEEETPPQEALSSFDFKPPDPEDEEKEDEDESDREIFGAFAAPRDVKKPSTGVLPEFLGTLGEGL